MDVLADGYVMYVCVHVCVLALKCGAAVGEVTGHRKRKKRGVLGSGRL